MCELLLVTEVNERQKKNSVQICESLASRMEVRTVNPGNHFLGKREETWKDGKGSAKGEFQSKALEVGSVRMLWPQVTA
jgi:hypothetical protein